MLNKKDELNYNMFIRLYKNVRLNLIEDNSTVDKICSPYYNSK